MEGIFNQSWYSFWALVWPQNLSSYSVPDVYNQLMRDEMKLFIPVLGFTGEILHFHEYVDTIYF